MTQIFGYKLWPNAFEGESRGEYLLRMADRNGARSLAEFGRPFNLSPSQMVILGPDVVKPVLRGLADSVPRLPRRAPELAKLLSRVGGTLRSRICPICMGLDAEPYLRATWELPLSCFCEKHSVWLVDRCEVCGRRLDIHRRSIAFCNCGTPLVSLSTEPVPNWVVRMAQVFAAPGDPARNSTFALSSPTERAAGRLLLTISTQMSGKKPQRSNGFLGRSQAESLRPWFEDWPQSFTEAISALRIIYGSPKWAAMYKPFKAWQFPPIRLAIEDAKFSEPTVDSALGIVVNQKEAERVTGLDVHTIRDAIKNGLIPEGVLAKSGAGRTAYHISVASLNQLESAFAQNVGAEEAARLAGCPTKVLLELARAKLTFHLPLGVSVYSRMRLDRSEIIRFVSRLCSVAVRKRSSAEHRVALPDMSRATDVRFASRTWKVVLAAIERRSLPLYTSSAKPTRLDQLYVSRSDLNRMRYGRTQG